MDDDNAKRRNENPHRAKNTYRIVSRGDIGAEELPRYVRQVDIPRRAPYRRFGIGIVITEIDRISRAHQYPRVGQ